MSFDIDLKNIKEVYQLMCDEESKKIFWDRLKYTMTQNKRYLLDMVSDAVDNSTYYKNPSNVAFNSILKKIIDNNEACDVVVWGASNKAMTIVELLFEFGMLGRDSVDCYYIDNDYSKCGKMFGWHNSLMDMPVYSPNKLKNIKKNTYVFIAVNTWSNDRKITEQLVNYGVEEDCIFHSLVNYEYFLEDMYFARGVMKPKDGDVFVDVGAFDMENTKQFIKWNLEFDHVYAFEADSVSYERCLSIKNNISKEIADKIDIYNMGVWSCKSKLNFESAPNGEFGGSRINSKGTKSVETVALDEFLKDKKIDIIKMDIEGAELEALKGAQNIIRANKPCLALSIYHKPQDIIELPLFVHEINRDYRFYLRHHTYGIFDTVMYAIDINRN